MMGTHAAIEAALGRLFTGDATLGTKLRLWGQQLVGDHAFGNVEQTKWRFVSLERAPNRERNPTWARDELILASDIYSRLDRSVQNKTHTEVLALRSSQHRYIGIRLQHLLCEPGSLHRCLTQAPFEIPRRYSHPHRFWPRWPVSLGFTRVNLPQPQSLALLP